MRLSFIVPAYNEEKYLAKCLESIKTSAKNYDYEIIVIDNLSTDNTQSVAREYTYMVFPFSGQSIASVRNYGASFASGDWLVFVDADTVVSEELIEEMAENIIHYRVIAGGAYLKLDTHSYLAQIIEIVWAKICKSKKWFTGSFMFCSKKAFNVLGGFDEGLFLAEDLDFSARLATVCSPIYLKATYVTSARKLHTYNLWEHLRFLIKLALNAQDVITSRSACFIHYDARR